MFAVAVASLGITLSVICVRMAAATVLLNNWVAKFTHIFLKLVQFVWVSVILGLVF